MKTANPGGPSVISVHIVATNLNGEDVDVRVTDRCRLGEWIPERLNVVAAEAAALASEASKLNDGRPIHRDRTTR